MPPEYRARQATESTASVAQYLEEMERITSEISRPEIDRAIDILFEAWKRGSTVFVMGNGGSASTATHLACDLAKYTIVDEKPRFRVFGLTDNVPLVSAWTNDSGYESIFVEQLKPWLKKDDVLIGISVHGAAGSADAGPWSQNLVHAMVLARERGARIIGLSGFTGGAMKEMADACVIVPITDEPLGTPLVESWHVTLHHLLCFALRQRILASA
ncbi:MAG TPA: SIS domain-containing protein [bacterium]|nr:SIS domain-containing protein [bacterium]